MRVVELVAALFAVAGTLMQARASLLQQMELDPKWAESYRAVDALKREYRPIRHPIRYWRRQKDVDRLLAESPVEAQRYRRVREVMWAWALLVGASFLYLLTALVVSS